MQFFLYTSLVFLLVAVNINFVAPTRADVSKSDVKSDKSDVKLELMPQGKADPSEKPVSCDVWKRQKIREAQKAYFDLVQKYETSSKPPSGIAPEKFAAERSATLSRARTNIQIATALSPGDCLNLHVKKFLENRDQTAQLLRLMSPEQIADLMIEFNQSLQKAEQELGVKAPIVAPMEAPIVSGLDGPRQEAQKSSL